MRPYGPLNSSLEEATIYLGGPEKSRWFRVKRLTSEYACRGMSCNVESGILFLCFSVSVCCIDLVHVRFNVSFSCSNTISCHIKISRISLMLNDVRGVWHVKHRDIIFKLSYNKYIYISASPVGCLVIRWMFLRETVPMSH